jgi:hypothetical protein
VDSNGTFVILPMVFSAFLRGYGGGVGVVLPIGVFMCCLQ